MNYANAELEKAASSVGIRVSTEGELPESEIIQRIFLLGGLECLLSACQPAGAADLRIVIQRNKQRRTVLVRFSCVGSRRMGRIQPTDGLQSLRSAVEEAHGVMSLSDSSDFSLEIELPTP